MSNESQGRRPPCLSCLKEIEIGNGVNFSSVETEVCRPCFDLMSPFERVMLSKLFNHDEEGSLADFLFTATQTVSRAFEIFHGHPLIDDCDSCNSEAFRPRGEDEDED